MEEVAIQYTEQWTTDQTQVAELTIQKAKAFNWLHHESYLYYASWGRVTTFIVSAATFLMSTAGIIVTYVDIPEQTIKIIQTVFYGFFILASIIGIAFGIWNPDNKATEHYNFAMKNKELYANLSTDLVEIITHDQIHQMLIDILKMELHMRDDAPIIPKNIWKKYYRRYGNKALKMDTLLCDDDIILHPTTIRSAHVLSSVKIEGGCNSSDGSGNNNNTPHAPKMVTLKDSYPVKTFHAQELYDKYVRQATREHEKTNADAEVEKAMHHVDDQQAKNKLRASSKIESRRVISPKDEFELARFNND